MFLSACENYSFLSSILLIKRIIEIACMLVPLFLVLTAGIALAKIVVNPNVQMTRRDVKKIANKFIAAAAVFFVPLFVSILMTTLGRTSVLKTDCWTNANNEAIAVYRAQKEMEDAAEKERLDSEHAEAEKTRKEVEEARERQRQENEKKTEEELKKYQQTGGLRLGDVIYYCQADYYMYPYGSYGTIRSHGCGPTSCAIIASTWFGPEGHSPVDTTNWICAHNGCTSNGSYFYVLTNYLETLGVQASEYLAWNKPNIERMNEALLSGNSMVIILVHEDGEADTCAFTNGGHYLVITGIVDGEYSIADPAGGGPERNKHTWPESSFSACDRVSFYIYTKP